MPLNRAERRSLEVPRVTTFQQWIDEKPDGLVKRREVFNVTNNLIRRYDERLARLEEKARPWHVRFRELLRSKA